MAALIISLFLLTSFGLLKFWPVTAITTNRQPYAVLTPKVHVGENMVYVVDACKHIAVRATVSRFFVGMTRYPSITTIGGVSKGCNKSKVSLQVPNFVEPGLYHLELSVTYEINKIRDDTYYFTTDSFEVLPATDSAH